MNIAHESIDSAIIDLDRLRRTLKKKKAKQVNSLEERSIIKATALAWFNNYRSKVTMSVDDELIQKADKSYKEILSASDRAALRSTYDRLLKTSKTILSDIRGYTVMPNTPTATSTTDIPPKFDPLITDLKMQKILTKRWNECCRCLSSNAPLSATVMMGGLLEALLLAKVNKTSNKSLIFKAKTGDIIESCV
jgi:hypothetical protein